MTTIDIYTALREQVGDQQAKMLTEYIEQKTNETVEQKATGLATKEDIHRLEVTMAKDKAEMLKWMFIYFTSQITIQTGIIVGLLKIFGN